MRLISYSASTLYPTQITSVASAPYSMMLQKRPSKPSVDDRPSALLERRPLVEHVSKIAYRLDSALIVFVHGTSGSDLRTSTIQT